MPPGSSRLWTINDGIGPSRPWREGFARAPIVLKTIESIGAAALILAALVLFLFGMVTRWLDTSIAGGWVEEVTIYLVTWASLLAAASAVALNEHIRADFFLRLIGPDLRYAADILASLTGLVYCVIMTWLGYLVVEFAIAWDERGSTILQIPRAYFYSALPVSLGFCALRYVLQITELVQRGRLAETPDHTT